MEFKKSLYFLARVFVYEEIKGTMIIIEKNLFSFVIQSFYFKILAIETL